MEKDRLITRETEIETETKREREGEREQAEARILGRQRIKSNKTIRGHAGLFSGNLIQQKRKQELKSSETSCDKDERCRS
jgi:hypothetical protein